METGPVPGDLDMILAGESPDFLVRAARTKRFRDIARPVIIGLVIVLISLALLRFLVLYEGESGSGFDGGTFIGVLIFSLLILLVGGSLIVQSFRSTAGPGPWFIGTPSRLIVHQVGSTRSTPWEQACCVERGEGSLSGRYLLVELTTGHWAWGAKGGRVFEPDAILMAGVPDTGGIERTVRRRIREHSPPLSPGGKATQKGWGTSRSSVFPGPLPPALAELCDDEVPDFIVPARRTGVIGDAGRDLRGGVALLFVGFMFFWIGGKGTFAGALPWYFLAIALLPGFALLAYSLFPVFATGPWFIGTPSFLIIHGDRSTRSIRWERFTEARQNGGTTREGNIRLGMRTMRYPGKAWHVTMAGVMDVPDLEKMLTFRIQEHEPATPHTDSGNVPATGT